MAPHTILLSGNPIYPQEKLASESITPGHLVQIVPSGGDAGQLRKHATAGGNTEKAFAYQSLTPDRTAATEAIDTPWADGETTRWLICRSGDIVYAWIPAAAPAIVEGDILVSNGDGTLVKGATQAVNEGGSATYTVFQTAVVGFAAEAVNNSGGGTAVRLRVRVA